MKVHRITLHDYRGVASCELTFADRGVTVVEGDNEVGKSSAAEALHLLIECYDDSTRKEVKAVKPLHRDAGAEVEAEVSAGPHRFVYTKRWHRRPFTRLKVLAPTPEVLSGREAHDRVRELLAETVDLDLWRALSSPQAAALEQRALRDHPSLVAALDAAAGGDLGAGDQGDLLTEVATQAGRWHTATGRPRAELTDARRRAGEAHDRVAACRLALEALEADASWCADLQRSADDLAPKLEAATAAADAAAAHRAHVEQRCASVEHLAVAARLAASEAARSAEAVAARAALAERSASDVAVRDAAAARAEVADAARRTAESALLAATEEAGSAVTALGDAEVTAESATAAHAGMRAHLALAEVDARLAAAASHQAALDELRSALAAIRSTPAALAALQVAHEEVLELSAALAAGQTSVRLEALADVSLEVDGALHHLAPSEVAEHQVASHLTAEVPGTLRITVAAGADAQVLHDRLRTAQAALAARCAALGVEDLAGAQTLEQERRELASRLDARCAELQRDLGDVSVDALAARAGAARSALDGVVEHGVAPTDADVAHTALRREAAQERLRGAERAADLAAAEVAAHRGRADDAAAALAGARDDVAAVERRAAVTAARLVAARAELDDEALLALAADAEVAVEGAAAAWRVAEAEVADLDPPAAARAAQRTAAERDGVEAALQQVREDLAAIRARLDLQGEAGLHDRLGEALTEAVAADQVLDAVEARAAAAQLLLATLTRHRDEAARAYGAPLRAEIEALGRLVFGDGFEVLLDDELRVAARVLDGVPVPWAQLSVGAKEQLGILTRLAAATLVSNDGGVPVVFDDVLGFSDPGKLVLVASAIEAAAEHCQIIVLTCDPARYRHLARATTHCLTAPRGVDARRAG